MRVLTVRQPWAWAIVQGGKDVENRSRNIAGNYRGPVAIHAAAREAAEMWEPGGPVDTIARITDRVVVTAQRSAIIGVVDLVEVHHAAECWRKPWKHEVEGWCTPWATEDNHHLVLDNPRALATPIPAKGRLGLWHPDAELEHAIATALATDGKEVTE